MTTQLTLPLLCLLSILSLPVSALSQDISFEGGGSPYTPQQLHELLVGQNNIGVINFFGRAPNHQQGFDWIYNRLLIEIPECNQYYTTAVICFSHGDHRVWQVVCYP
jgi:hypothetical protein